jgi:hypothetical protein
MDQADTWKIPTLSACLHREIAAPAQVVCGAVFISRQFAAMAVCYSSSGGRLAPA